jgi:hypothetical protein
MGLIVHPCNLRTQVYSCPEIFLPPRSMVLKVVTGKILETLELSGCPTGPEAAPVVRLSKIVDYLLDNLCDLMLSKAKAGGQGRRR